MPARPKPSRQPQRRPPPPAAWSGWIDVAVGLGRAVIACELLLAAVALSALPSARPARRAVLALVHSRRSAAAPPRCYPPPSLLLVRRDEGKA